MILLLVCSALFIILSWYCYSNSYHRVSIVLLFCGGILLRFFVASDDYLHPWDERYHALVAKHSIENPLRPVLYKTPILDYELENWTGNHIWLHKQPVSIWIIGASLKIWGISELAVRFPSLVLSSISILLIFSLAQNIFNKRVAYISAFLFTINGLILEVGSGRTATDHVDLLFMTLILLAVWLSYLAAKSNARWYMNCLVGFVLGLAILTKWLPALIVLPIWIGFRIHAKRPIDKDFWIGFLNVCLVTALTAIPWQLYIHAYFPVEAQWEGKFNIRHIFEPLEGMGGSFFYHFDYLRINYGELVYLPILWFTYRLYVTRKEPRWAERSLFVWFLVPYVFFSFVETKMQAYTLFAAPAVFLIVAIFYDQFITLKRSKGLRFLTSVLLLLLIALPIRFSLERIKPFKTIEEMNPKWSSDRKGLVKNIKNINESVIFNDPHNIETMFYTGITSYSYIPSLEIIDSVRNIGYEVYINNCPSDSALLSKSKQLNLANSSDF